MKVRFIVDAQLPPGLARALTEAGFTARHVQDMGLLAASDLEIWERALKDRAVVITKDGDFVGLHKSGAGGAAVIWLRIGNTASGQLVRWLLPLMPEIAAALDAGETLLEIQR